MTTLRSTDDNRKRREEIIAYITETLNREVNTFWKTTKSSSEKLIEILTDMQKVESIRLALRNSASLGRGRPRKVQNPSEGGKWPFVKFTDRQLQEMNEEGSRTLKRLNDRLLRLRWSPGIETTDFGRFAQFPTWHYKSDDERVLNHSIYLLLNFLMEGQIDTWRKCADCSRWFYARTEHQRYCADRCRRHYSASSPEFKEKRARYMREKYRPFVKACEQRDKQAATLKGYRPFSRKRRRQAKQKAATKGR